MRLSSERLKIVWFPALLHARRARWRPSHLWFRSWWRGDIHPKEERLLEDWGQWWQQPLNQQMEGIQLNFLLLRVRNCCHCPVASKSHFFPKRLGRREETIHHPVKMLHYLSTTTTISPSSPIQVSCGRVFGWGLIWEGCRGKHTCSPWPCTVMLSHIFLLQHPAHMALLH